MAKLYKYMDGRGDLFEVEEVMIPGVGLGLSLRTTHSGPCIPMEEIPRLINALKEGLHVTTGTKERQHGKDHSEDY
ncbi:hypothetical protein OG381_34540 [Streptomyces sp. NBC_00490]|uniref:hypothetical protein n=1 Tax=Streptomyces sp. NBC_00490 TaxID=2903657 RepID=UPI002E185D17